MLIGLSCSGDGTPIIRKVIDRSEKINGTTFTRGDYCVAVRWLERSVADSERLTFLYNESDPPDVVNSTELRAHDFKLEPGRDLPTPRTTRSTKRKKAAQKNKLLKDGIHHLPPEIEKTILSSCW